MKKQAEGNITHITSIMIVVMMMTTLMVHGDYLTIASSDTTNLLVWITENGTVTNVGAPTSLTNPLTISSQYYFSGQTYYALHDSKYLFSYSPSSQSNETVLLRVAEGSQLVTLCVSQQFGTLYAIQLTDITACLVQINADTGDITPSAAPFTLNANTQVVQCIVDDAFSRVVWTYKTLNATQQTTCSIATTDILPQSDGDTSQLYNDTLFQMWIFFDWSAETFYATTISQAAPQLSILSIAVNGVKKTVLIPKVGVNMTTAQGAMNTESGMISIFSEGLMEQINIANASAAPVNLVWGPLGQLNVNAMSVAWVPQVNYLLLYSFLIFLGARYKAKK